MSASRHRVAPDDCRAIGDGALRGLVSVLSPAAIPLLAAGYRRAHYARFEPLWTAPARLGWVLIVRMAAAFVLPFGSVSVHNPTAVGGERPGDAAPHDMLRITRHPLLGWLAIWSAVHVIGRPSLIPLLLFGAFGVMALVGMPSNERKIGPRDPAGWRHLAARTSILPFGAIPGRRNRLVPREIGWIAPAAGLAPGVILPFLHTWLFHAAPVPDTGW